MRGAIYRGKESVEVRDLLDPVCNDRGVVVANVLASVCGTDAAIYAHGPNTGHKVDVGGEFGHEVVSRVIEVGPDVCDLAVGDRVYPYPLLAKDDPRRAGTMGAFSQEMLIPRALLGRSLYEVPDSIDDRTACLIEPFTVGCRAARRGRPAPSEKAIVYGAGTIGIAAAIALVHFGVDDVLVCDRSDLRLSKAADLGFAICDVDEESPYAVAAELFGTAPGMDGTSADVDLVIDAAGGPAILEAFMDQAKIGSRFVSVAVSKGLRQVDLLGLTYAQKSIIGSGGYMSEDVVDVMAIMASGQWDIASIVTHEFPLERIDEALQLAGDPTHALNVTIALGDGSR
jgi:threonine dehydrogenase-like Zn-dependent dehydrogenase